jgi:hypothetical protein
VLQPVISRPVEWGLKGVYLDQEFLGVLLVVAGLMGTVLFVGVAFILFREGM